MYGVVVANYLARFARRASDMLFTGNRATIDGIRLAPPPTPLAPVNLTDPEEIHRVLNLAARIGDQLLAAGTGNSDAKAEIKAIAAAYGLHYTHVDITLNTITVYAHNDESRSPVSAFRVVKTLSTNFSRLTEIDRLVRSIIAGATPLDTAEQILAEIERSPLPFRTRWALLSWGGFAFSIALLLGGGYAVAFVATITTLFIMFSTAWLASKSLPEFYQNFLGGFIAVLPAAVVTQFATERGWYFPPSLVVASCIVAQLAGLTLVQALQDAVTGAPVTASARFFETVLNTGAIIAGIGAALQFVHMVGIDMTPLDVSTTSGVLGGTTVRVLSGAAATVFFCLACFTERRATVVAAATALVASIAHNIVQALAESSTMMPAAAAAILVGMTGGLLSRRYMVPPQITAAAGITPFLPGLALYRGMSSILQDKLVIGMSNLALAAATATTLAAGVVFGEWVARRLRRPRILHREYGLRRPRIAVRERRPRRRHGNHAAHPLDQHPMDRSVPRMSRKREGTRSLWSIDSLLRTRQRRRLAKIRESEKQAQQQEQADSPAQQDLTGDGGPAAGSEHGRD